MRLAAYIVTVPQTREELLREILSKIAASGEAELTIQSVDDLQSPVEKSVRLATRQSQNDGFGQHFFSGYFIDDEDHERYLFNLTIPPWDCEPATIKIMHAPFDPKQEDSP